MIKLKDYPVIIPIGGEGKRLKPFTKDRSKAVVPLFNNVPIMEISIFNLTRELGLRNFILGVKGYQNYLDIRLYYEGGFGWSAKMGIKPQAHFRYQNPNYEDEGSADSVLFNIKKYNIKQPVLVFQSDNIFSPGDVESLWQFSNENDFDLVIGLTKVKNPKEYGLVEFDKDGKTIKRFLEKSDKVLDKNALINTGVYIIKPKAFNDLKKDFGHDVLPIIARQQRLGGLIFEKPWLDFGTAKLHQKSFQNILGECFDYLLPYLKRTSRKITNTSVWVRGRDPKYRKFSKDIETAIKQNKISTKGKVLMGRDCEIDKNVSLESCSVGDMAIIKNGASISKSNVMDAWQVGQKVKIEESTLGRNGSVSDFSTIEKSFLGDNVSVGSKLKIKNQIIPKHSRIRK